MMALLEVDIDGQVVIRSHVDFTFNDCICQQSNTLIHHCLLF